MTLTARPPWSVSLLAKPLESRQLAVATFEGLDIEGTIQAFARIPLGQKLYPRPTWRDLQKRPVLADA